MSKILAWILSITKLGKIVEPIQAFLSGKKAYISGLGLLVPALLTMLQHFSDLGLTYLTGITGTNEWVIFLNGLAVMGIRAGISKAAVK